ncbi:sigma-70 family RNA polymerase sigma factor [Bordetella sp. N]|uniref:sigma-70 family RNA polymerase sigma factor n=1 Tax=Bordetella sp. N TaxID=1746199 RepID=UPI00070D3BF9|nr:sigma-70 family RNA polymerase sigma factor [Bordetella sp. N]ALM84808.1 RNA polymerase subunit sigma [Bordetella sp. N]
MPAELSMQKDLRALYLDHHGWLQGWLRRRLGSAADAADLAQDAFVRLMARSAPVRFATAAEARGYLRTTAHNLCVNLWHRQEIERAWLETLAAQPEASYPSAERQAIVLQALHEVGAMLSALPEKAAQAFVLTVACQMTDLEVAAELRVSDRSVRRYVAQVMLACLKLRARQTVGELRQDGRG